LDFNWTEDYSDESTRKKLHNLQEEVFGTIIHSELENYEKMYENNKIDLENLRLSVEDLKKERKKINNNEGNHFSFSFENSKLPMVTSLIFK
jgi:hypothetical protein